MTQNAGQTEDLRVRRTRKLLQQAMLDLAVEKGFSAVTVHDIAERAMVNRATFYRHYLDKYDLLEQYMNAVYELTASQDAASQAQAHDPTFVAPPSGLVSLLQHVRQHADFYRVMLGKQGDVGFARHMQQYIEKRFRSILPSQEARMHASSLPLDLCLSYMSHASVGAIAWWVTEGVSSTPEEVAAWLSQLSKVSINLALGRHT